MLCNVGFRRIGNSTKTLLGLYSRRWNSSLPLVHYKVQGEKDGKSSAMILHGLFGSTTNWGPITTQLLKQNVFDQVILCDLRNHGKSFHHPTFTVPEMANDIHRLLEHLSIPEDFTLIGHSLGGKVAMQLALEGNLSNSSKLVVVDVAPLKYDTRKSFSAIVNALCDLDISSSKSRKDIESDFAKLLPDENPLVRSFLLSNLYPDGDGYKWRINLESIAKSLEKVGEMPRESHEGHSDIETLFIAGSNSTYIPKEEKTTILKYFPNAKIEYIDGAGHWVHYEKPKEVIELIKEFKK